ncbi:MAG: histidine ammonia-lyase HutH [Acidiferrobacteraceae bacterium]|jgi:histidine ammonia-lyase|nr:histidine ammonia-lyase HutH [Acidiferrobacteraceae bacterium]MCP4828811.1 aromatic amino acid lyase [Pseudomonadota bacterium]HJP07446.1 aromatic amino acid ammonia-lyase [Arenicellales bacterium]|tara:strand:- start:16927 stop:18576 length:1650 start_codon:yes stop_codon:yes gene_type:complete
MTMSGKTLTLNGQDLSLEQLVEAGHDPSINITIQPSNWPKIEQCRALVEKWADEEQVIYGVNTSCGGLVNYLLPKGNDREFQQNLIRSVSTNVGTFLPDELVRTTMIARVNSLCRGYSGIKSENLKIYLEMINRGVVPCVPEQGSLGSSGDLGPLGCIACVAIGEWKAHYQGKLMDGGAAMAAAGIPLMKLNAKEGLSMINGTSCMASIASSNVFEAGLAIKQSDALAALSIETLLGRANPFDLRVHRQKYHPGQYATAYNLSKLLEGSDLVLNEQEVSENLQGLLKKNNNIQAADIPVEDAYSLRCTPQLIGPCRDGLQFARDIVNREINSSNDNPLIFTEYDTFIHNGHFQGQYLSLAMDNIATVMTTVSVISDRRIDRFMDASHSVGLPPFLVANDTGLRMGFMPGQFMTSSVVAENRTLCLPASVQSIPSTADFQDVVSFGLIAGRKARKVVRNTNYVLAFELMCGAQAADIRGADRLSPASRALYEATRETVPYLDYDTVIIDYLEEIARRLRQGEFLERVEQVVGPLMMNDTSGGREELAKAA